MRKTTNGTIEFTPTELHNYKNEWSEEVRKHTHPSPETLKIFNNMEKEITNIKINMEGQKKDIEHIKGSLTGINDKMNTFITKADDCYARKENLVKLEGFITKVMWVSIITLVGFLIEVVWFLITQLLK